MNRSTAALATALALALAAPSVGAEEPAEPSAEALARGWFDQLFGASSIEAWSTEWAGGEIVFALARRWQDGRPETFVHLVSPRAYDELNFLLRDGDAGRLELLYYRTPKLWKAGAKAARVMPAVVPSPIDRLPFVPGLPALAEIQPPRISDYAYARLPDQVVANQPCRVIEARPRAGDLGFDRVRYSLAQETGVSLETVWWLRETLVRRVTIAPGDVRDYSGRFLPTRRSVERPGSGTQVYELGQLMLDPPFPDQLFTTQNLKAGRFPSY
ncbi:MAG: outer membrane lipoprotein-sorting protein [Deltaproteobacteria bacterium]|nr:outer membrane lipoprotein-sorting protein [Deltaproteobacteria bacterium]